MTVDIVAYLRMEVISIIRVCVIDERVLVATGLCIECNSLPVLLSPSIFPIGLEWLHASTAGLTTIDRDIDFFASAVAATVGLDPDCKAALSEDGGGNNKELRQMHI
jgi:hypothetical protein